MKLIKRKFIFTFNFAFTFLHGWSLLPLKKTRLSKLASGNAALFALKNYLLIEKSHLIAALGVIAELNLKNRSIKSTSSVFILHRRRADLQLSSH